MCPYNQTQHMEECNISGAFDEFVESTYSSLCSEHFLLNWEILLLINQSTLLNKRAQRALGRSPEEKVKGHSGFNNREPQGHNLNNFGRGPFDDVIY